MRVMPRRRVERATCGNSGGGVCDPMRACPSSRHAPDDRGVGATHALRHPEALDELGAGAQVRRALCTGAWGGRSASMVCLLPGGCCVALLMAAQKPPHALPAPAQLTKQATVLPPTPYTPSFPQPPWRSAPSTILVSGESAGAVSCFRRSDAKAAHTPALGARSAAGAFSTDPSGKSSASSSSPAAGCAVGVEVLWDGMRVA